MQSIDIKKINIKRNSLKEITIDIIVVRYIITILFINYCIDFNNFIIKN